MTVPLRIGGAALRPQADLYRYTEAAPTEIVHEKLTAGSNSVSLDLPASSITILELALAA